MKPILSRFTMAVITALCSLSVYAYDFQVDGIYYYSHDDATASVTYESRSNATYSGNVVIPESVTYNGTEYAVTGISDFAFYGCTSLQSVEMPNSVTSIGESAFYNCSSLQLCNLSKGLTSIGGYAFFGCTSYQSITVPSSVTSIGKSAFSNGDSSLSDGYSKKIFWLGNTPPKGFLEVTTYFNKQFYFTPSINYVSADTYDFSNSDSKTTTWYVYRYLSSLFEVDGSIYVPVSPSERTCDLIDCKYGVNLQDLSISEKVSYRNIEMTVNKIMPYAFCRNNTICNATLSNSGSVGEYAFYGCSNLKTVNATNDGNIGDYAFSDCDALESVVFNTVGAIGNNALYDDTRLQSVAIGPQVYSLGEFSFSNCSSLTEVTIPDNVTYIGSNAFSGCGLLSSVKLSHGLKSMPDYLFSGCNALGSIVIPGNITSIGDYVFAYCRSLSDVTFEELVEEDEQLSVLTLGSNDSSPLFKDCPLVEVFIGRRLSYNRGQKYGYSPFYFNTSLRSVTIADAETEIYDYEFFGCSKLSLLMIGHGVNSIGAYAFGQCYSLTEVTIPDNVISVGENAFRFCSSLESVTLSKGLKILPEELFLYCESLSSISIPGNITSINNDVFRECSSLRNVTFEDTVDADEELSELQLGYSGFYSPMFSDCPLDEVYIGRKLVYDYSPFYRNTSLRAVTIADAETQIYDNEFYGCSHLQSLKIGDGVTAIGKYAFSGCSALEEFSAGAAVESIGEEAFSDCTAMKNYYSFSAVPPTCGTQALDDINKWECVLHVPAESLDAYKAAPQWKEFFFLEDVTGNDAVTADTDCNMAFEVSDGTLVISGATDKTVAIYSVDGSLRARYDSYAGQCIELPRGVYVVRVAGMEARKVSI